MAFESEEVEHLLIISLEFPIADSMACFKEREYSKECHQAIRT